MTTDAVASPNDGSWNVIAAADFPLEERTSGWANLPTKEGEHQVGIFLRMDKPLAGGEVFPSQPAPQPNFALLVAGLDAWNNAATPDPESQISVASVSDSHLCLDVYFRAGGVKVTGTMYPEIIP